MEAVLRLDQRVEESAASADHHEDAPGTDHVTTPASAGDHVMCPGAGASGGEDVY